ncbi:MAG TPA: saccharopine dehydrogenase NADP-binding domain-containing protein [Candidatus Acidoferrales bacterium]|nr:saccharopine dehydrogenase NADP-binding domain-containing protein [Candidatus Acidoferrales bacterium]
MRRLIVVGAGFFGSLITRRLREIGLAPLVATRQGADLRLDVESEASLTLTLREGDVIVDTAGPFATRTTRLARAAIERGCDVVDLADSLPWSEAILALDPRASDAGVALYTACSAIAAVTGACVRASGVASPVSVDQFLAPASAETASPATVRAFVTSLGRTIRTYRDGHLVDVRGYVESRAFPSGARRGSLVENAGAVLLPRSWPSLRRAEFWVDPNTPLGRPALTFAARVPPLAALARAVAPRIGAGPFGRRDGVLAVAVDQRRAFVLASARRSYRIATEPAVMVADALIRGRRDRGVVLPHAQLYPEELFRRLRAMGIAVSG